VEEADGECLEFIATFRRAWVEETLLETMFPGSIDRLELEGLLDRWERPDGIAMVLSPFAAWFLGMAMIETTITGTPRWAPSIRSEHKQIPVWFSPQRYPRVANEVRIFDVRVLENMKACQYHDHQYLIDEVTGEPMVLFAGDPKLRYEGIKVIIDKRLKA
jgi:hypothetical protein